MLAGGAFFRTGINLHHGRTGLAAGLAIDMETGIVASISCTLASHGEGPTVTARSLNNIPGVCAFSEDCSFGGRRACGHRLEEKDSSSCKLHDWRT